MTHLGRIGVIVLVLLAALPRHVSAQNPPDTTGVAVDAVLTEVQKALVEAQTVLAESSLPTLSSVTLTLQTECSTGGGMKINFLVFSFGTTWEKKVSNEMVLTLRPPKGERLTKGFNPPHISTQLANAIRQAAQGVREAANRQPPLVVESLALELGFVVKKGGSGGAAFEITPVTVGLSGDMSKTAVHTIKLVFAAS